MPQHEQRFVRALHMTWAPAAGRVKPALIMGGEASASCRAGADPYRTYWVRPHPDENTKYVIACMYLPYSHPPNPNVCTHTAS